MFYSFIIEFFGILKHSVYGFITDRYSTPESQILWALQGLCKGVWPPLSCFWELYRYGPQTHRSHVGYEIIGDTSPYFHPCKSNSCMGKLCFLLLDIKLQFILVTYGPFCRGGCWSWFFFNPGQKNHVLFIILLAGFVLTEASYVASSAQCKPEFFMPKYICERIYCKNRKSLFCCSALDRIG